MTDLAELRALEAEMDHLDPGHEKLIGVAIRWGGNIDFVLMRPARHVNVMETMHREGLHYVMQAEQGFVSNRGRFLTRWQAARVAAAACQCDSRVLQRTKGELFSEDVW